MKHLNQYINEGFKLNSDNANIEFKLLKEKFGDIFQIREKRTGNYELLYKDEVDNLCRGCRKYDINDYTIRCTNYKYNGWGLSQIVKACNNIKEVINELKKYLEMRNKKGLK